MVFQPGPQYLASGCTYPPVQELEKWLLGLPTLCPEMHWTQSKHSALPIPTSSLASFLEELAPHHIGSLTLSRLSLWALSEGTTAGSFLGAHNLEHGIILKYVFISCIYIMYKYKFIYIMYLCIMYVFILICIYMYIFILCIYINMYLYDVFILCNSFDQAHTFIA